VRISEIIKFVNARVIVGEYNPDMRIEKAFSSDLMSDVLTLDEDNILLITGLSNIQLLRTAEMANVRAILLARDKTASPEMIQLARENKIVLLESPFSMFKVSGILYSHGLKPVY
jgi:predicted transcriptional regulator